MEKISVKEATIINFISKYSNVIIQLLLNAILARLLTPDDYGIVAVITVFTGFFTLIADMGVGPAIIQNKTLNNDDVSSIFNFTVISGIVVTIIFCSLSYPISLFYRDDIYISLVILMSLGILFNVLNIVPNALLMKEKKFRLVAIRTVSITVICGIVTIILAYLGLKYYAIVINSILIGLFTFLFNFYSVRIKLVWKINKNSLYKIKHYSIYQFGFSFINYFSRNLDNLLIGRLLGQVALGYYDKAYKLVLYPVSNLTHVITPILHPILSDHQEDKIYIYLQYKRIIKILSLLGVFITVYCFFASREVILVMYGTQWEKAIPSFQILSLTIWIQMVVSSSGTIFQSLGETKALFRAGYITTSINVIGIIIGLILGKIETISLMICITFFINFFMTFIILIKIVMRQSLKDFFSLFISDIIIAFLMIIGLYLWSYIKIENILVSAIAKFLVAFIFYSIGLILTKEFKLIKLFIGKS